MKPGARNLLMEALRVCRERRWHGVTSSAGGAQALQRSNWRTAGRALGAGARSVAGTLCRHRGQAAPKRRYDPLPARERSARPDATQARAFPIDRELLSRSEGVSHEGGDLGTLHHAIGQCISAAQDCSVPRAAADDASSSPCIAARAGCMRLCCRCRLLPPKHETHATSLPRGCRQGWVEQCWKQRAA